MKWIKFDENKSLDFQNLPDGDSFLVSDGDQITLGFHSKNLSKIVQIGTWVELKNVTHWMRLPAPPEIK